MFWRKKDHGPAIEKVVINLVSTGLETGVLPFLSMKEAIQYAYSKEGDPAVDRDGTNVQCHAVIDGVYYNLSFRPHPEKGVYLTPVKYYDVEE